MKKLFYTIFFLSLILTCSFQTQAQVYVNPNASGANDGSSWANAYTDLQMALDNTASGDLWVAQGTYVASNTHGYFVSGAVNIYGGFDGSETSLDQRDFNTNITHIEGDAQGDDTPGDFMNNRSDNRIHLIHVDSNMMTVRFDGLMFTGGNTLADADTAVFYRAGGGIFSYNTPVHVENCHFEDNWGRSGAGMYIIGSGASGSVLTNSTFESNSTTTQCGGAMFNSISNVTVTDCAFTSNETNRGALYTLRCDQALIDNCTFTGNYNAAGFGGAYFNWNTPGVTLSNCTFDGNSGNNAGAIYNDGRELEVKTITATNCVFDQNEATGGSGGAVFNANAKSDYMDCEFTGNAAGGGWGGAMTCYSERGEVNVSDCTFTSNSAATSGGALTCGFQGQLMIENTEFKFNDARFGGVIFVQDDTSGLDISNCEFELNIGNDSGGAINISAGVVSTIDNCIFLQNDAPTGGAITLSEDTVDIANCTITNTIFESNNANESQGGAISSVNTDVHIENSVFNFNSSANGTGGAISNNASGGQLATLTSINNTFANNSGSLASCIAQWTDTEGSVADLQIQNTILFGNIGDHYAIEDGAPTVTSLGGNLNGDATMVSYLTQGSDLNGLDPMFVGFDDFHLMQGSPCIDAGVDAGAPTTDLEGNPRVGQTDMGAYEYDGPVNTEEVELVKTDLTISPNPVKTFATVQLNNEWTGSVQVTITSLSGKVIRAFELEKAGDQLTYELDASDLATGVYNFTLFHNNEATVQRFLKQ